MRENKVVYGLIGYGGMGRWHTEILSQCFEAVIGMSMTSKRKERRSEGEGLFVYETEEAMLADPDIDVLDRYPNDCTINLSPSVPCMQGKNVISEKPVTLSSADLLRWKCSQKTGKLRLYIRTDGGMMISIIKKLVGGAEICYSLRIESRVHGSRGIPCGEKKMLWWRE